MEKTQRNFILGSEWLYYKIYSGKTISDHILTSIIYPLTIKFINNQYIDKWFFIRYADPELHIRIRFHVKEVKYLSIIINELHDYLNPYIEEKVVTRIICDMYKRELERYGHITIQESETLFYLDSNFMMQLMINIDNDDRLWLYGIKFIDNFLELWGLNLEQKGYFAKSLKNAYGNEHGETKKIRNQLNLKYRNYRDKIYFTLEKDTEIESILLDYKEMAHPNILSISNKYKEGLLEMEIEDLITSYIHMHCNKLFKLNQRTNEWILYFMLYKYYYNKIGLQKSKLIGGGNRKS